jgi:hypothetical protein
MPAPCGTRQGAAVGDQDAGVEAGRRLGHSGRLKIGPSRCGWGVRGAGAGRAKRSGARRVSRGWRRAEVVVAQSVGVALEAEDVGVVDEPVDHGDGGGLVAEDLAPG